MVSYEWARISDVLTLVVGTGVVVAFLEWVGGIMVELCGGVGMPEAVVVGFTGLVMVQLAGCERKVKHTMMSTYGQSVTVKVWLLVTV